MHAIALGTRPQLGYRYTTTTHARIHREEVELPVLREAAPEDYASSNRCFLAVHRELAARGLREKTRRRPRPIEA